MTSTSPVEAIVGTLTSGGYRSLAMPRTVAGVPFEFSAMLVGVGPVPDLIVVADTRVDPVERIRQKIEALGRALDVMQSRRPLTVVLTGPRPGSATLEALTRVCRVLLVGASELRAPDILREKLAALLPLEITAIVGTLAEPLRELAQRTASFSNKSMVDTLVATSSGGPERVTRKLKEIIEHPLTDASGNEL